MLLGERSSGDFRLLSRLHQSLLLLMQPQPLLKLMNQSIFIGQWIGILLDDVVHFRGRCFVFFIQLVDVLLFASASPGQVLCRVIHFVFIGFQSGFDLVQPVAQLCFGVTFGFGLLRSQLVGESLVCFL